MIDPTLENFITEIGESLTDGTFVKATVGNYKGGDRQLQKVTLRQVETKKGVLVQFVRKYRTRDAATNVESGAVADELFSLLDSGFRSVHLFTLKNDVRLAITKKGKALVSRSKPTFTDPVALSHDRAKSLTVDPSSKYLRLLGITREDGTVKDKRQSKFRQIDRFVAIIDRLIDEAEIRKGEPIKVVDMGCGKGYLTFALYDHLTRCKGLDVSVTGVEEREDLVVSSSAAAAECGFGKLRFVRGRIGETDPGAPDVLIALHACDTATDDAIFKGMEARSRLIVAAPCCQKELRGQISFPKGADNLNRYGLLLERETETITDALRAVLLESQGYKVRMNEFVAPEHTPKNNLITAVLDPGDRHSGIPLTAAVDLMRTYGISRQRLYDLMNPSRSPENP